MKKLLLLALALALSGCLWAPPPRHTPPPEGEPHPGPEPKAEEPQAEPPKEPEVPEHAPPKAEEPAPAPAPQLSIRVVPAKTRPGKMVELHLNPPVGKDVKVYWNTSVVLKETHADGAMIKVRVPGDATVVGQFHLEWQGKRFPSPVINLK